MTILTGSEILHQRHAGKIIIEPFEIKQLNPNSYNLRLGDKLVNYTDVLDVDHPRHPGDPKLYRSRKEVPGLRCLDMRLMNHTVARPIPETGLVLIPNVLYLGATIEHTETHGFAPYIEGRSSIGRLGVCVHVTAGFGDVGFRGRWTLEITVVHPIRIYPGVEICQIAYSTVEGEVIPYKGRYQDQKDVMSSKLWLDTKRKEEE
ncbi:MAG: dCTP deaminase [Acidobacteria bacterium]|nr:dCTP deaminase [Acidobacteriota bacterium]